jgi:hypothetical protein
MRLSPKESQFKCRPAGKDETPSAECESPSAAPEVFF